MKMFAGTDTEGSRDGLASPTEFCKPAGLCVACEQQTYFRSSLLSLRKIGGREATTENFSMGFSNRLFLKLCSFSVVAVVPLYPFERVRFSVSITEKKVSGFRILSSSTSSVCIQC